jgi:hypothetical protein
MTIISVLALGMVSGALLYAPGFLLYSTAYGKTDVIVLLLGPDFGARQKHAQDLMKKGFADYLIIPAYQKTYYMDQGSMKLHSGITGKERKNNKKNMTAPWYFEDTHVELEDAKRTMERYGKASAIFVSSPYHMRRIRIIVKKEFAAQHPYYFAPTPYEAAPRHFLELKPADWRKVYREYLKITWFMIYSTWAT